MKIIMESKGIEMTEALEAYISRKMGVLGKVLKHFETHGEVEVRLELVRTTRHHKKGEVYGVIASVNLPKKFLRADITAQDIRKGIDEARDMLRFDIEKCKEKADSAKRR